MSSEINQNDLPFQGIKVADFSWSIVGPAVTKYLADFGATVVKIESVLHPDVSRRMAPYIEGKSGLERAATYAIYNTSKYSLALNMAKPDGIQIARELIQWSDIVVETYRPGVMEKLGLGWEEIRKLRPDIIMLRGSLQGQTGPHRMQPGYGTMMQAMTGLVYTTGWADSPPEGLTVPLADFISANYFTVAAVTALDNRRRTGEGQCIDLGQLEATTTCSSTAILDFTANGRIQSRNGNRDSHAAPHGVFRCRGTERWCVIAVFNEEQWCALKTVINQPELDDPKFNSLEGRKQNEDLLETLIEGWTVKRKVEDIATQLQEKGVPSGVVENAEDLCKDAHLAERGFLHWMEHPVIGKHIVVDYPFKFSNVRVDMKQAPLLGQDTEWVCTKILGMLDERFVDLMAKGVFE